MEIVIHGSPKEIASLVTALQERQSLFDLEKLTERMERVEKWLTKRPKF